MKLGRWVPNPKLSNDHSAFERNLQDIDHRNLWKQVSKNIEPALEAERTARAASRSVAHKYFFR